MIKKFLSICLVSIQFIGFSQVEQTPLNSWFYEMGQRKHPIWSSFNMYMALQNGGYIEHPFTDNSDQIEYKIFNQPIEIECEFSGAQLMKKDHVELVFEGLDTYCTIVLNGDTLGYTNNAFRTWRFDVKDLLKRDRNFLKVTFTSPALHHQKTLASAEYKLANGNEAEASYSRKAAYQFGWDWAPKFVGCGIWRPAYIQSWNQAKITDLYVSTERANAEVAEIAYHIEIESAISSKDVILQLGGESHQIKLKEGRNSYTFEETIENPELWFPNGYGEQHLKTLMAHLVLDQDTIAAEACRYGIRTIELVNEPDDIGTSFYFIVNGQPIYAKGANWVPMSSFPSAVYPRSYQMMLERVKDANMNMLRVWGGGIYEDDVFYQFCDELGILVWQDFMFANSTYPANTEFLENIKVEAEQNIKRLRKHPCIALWCGNNEIEVAWNNWGWQRQYGWSKEDSTAIWNNYLEIFEGMLPLAVKTNHPKTPYVPTSPQSNWGTKDNFNHGSMHYWGVWHGTDNFEDYQNNVGRFMVEYGFQSYPNLRALKSYSRRPLTFDSPFLKNRQKSYVGDKLIFAEIEKRYGRVNELEEWLLLSQHIQAIALKEAIQHHRLKAPHCMGTLFWQLNDCWPGPSWSVIDYHMTPKVAYEVVKNVYSPSIAVVDTIDNEIQIWATTDETTPQEASLDIAFIENDTNTFYTKSIPITIEFLDPKIYFRYPMADLTTEIIVQNVSIKVSLRNRNTDDWLFKDVFYFGLSPKEKAILNN